MRVQVPPARFPVFPSFFFTYFFTYFTRQLACTHTMNRIQHFLDERAEVPSNEEFFVVTGEFGRVFVTREVARHLRTRLDKWFPPRWLEFRSYIGSHVRVRSAQVESIVQSTFAQREQGRRFSKALDQEENKWEAD